MNTQPGTKWIRAGLVALPVYGLLTAWSSMTPQPDLATDPDGWARFVSAPAYQVSHLVGSVGGTILAIFGMFALGAYLAPTRAGRLALAAMVVTVLGQALLMVPAVISTFASPAIGRAYLSGLDDVMQIQFSDTLISMFLIGLLLAFVGTVLLGVAMWRSHTVPRGAAVLWIIATVVFYPLGVVLGMATVNASLPTQAIGAFLIAISGGWIAWGAFGGRRAQSKVAAPA
ncbi:MAG: DUF2427 domain-containing protein [Microbacterium sp.]